MGKAMKRPQRLYGSEKRYFERFKFELPCVHIIIIYPSDFSIASLFTLISPDDFTRRKTSAAVDQFRSYTKKIQYYVSCVPFKSYCKVFSTFVQGKNSISGEESNRMFILRRKPLTGIVGSGGRLAYRMARATVATSNLKKKRKKLLQSSLITRVRTVVYEYSKTN